MLYNLVMSNYKIFVDSCCDLSKETRNKYDISYFRMGLVVDGEEKYADLDWEEYSQVEFYNWLREGKSVKTTQVSIKEFIDKMTLELDKGFDILYLGCSSKLSGSINVFNLAKEELQEKYKNRTIIGIDTLTSSVNEGFLALEVAKLKQQGMKLTDAVNWVENHKLNFNMFATVDTLTYLNKSGRIKGLAAFFGNIIGVKPIFISDKIGNNYVINKVKGTKNSIEALVEGIKETIILNKDNINTIYIGHADALDKAELIKSKLEDLGANIVIEWIGPIVGTSCGPGTLGVFCYGKEVTRYEGESLN